MRGCYLKLPGLSVRGLQSHVDSQETLKGSLSKELSYPPAFRLLSKTFILFSFSLCSLFPLMNFSLLAVFFKLVAMRRAIAHADFRGSRPDTPTRTVKRQDEPKCSHVCTPSRERGVKHASLCSRGVEALCDSACGRIK